MTTLREAAEQALEALEAETSVAWECNSYHPKIYSAITALRQALEAEQQAEPVAWGQPDVAGNIIETITTDDRVCGPRAWSEMYSEPLYTHPQPTPQPLTEELLHSLWLYTPVDYYTDNESIFKQAARAIEHSHNIK